MWAAIGENKANVFSGLRGLDGPSVVEQKALATDCGHLAMGNPTCTGSGENQ
jgi:hypothetical protein